MKRWILLQLLVVSMILCGCGKMTEEDRLAYEELHHHEYEVESVYQYIKTETNVLGGIMRQEPRYCFTYIGDDGNLHQFDDFEHTEYGLWKICMGDENRYVVEDGFDTYRWLYLTEDTLKDMKNEK